MARWKVLHFPLFWSTPWFKVNISFTEPFLGDKKIVIHIDTSAAPLLPQPQR